MAATPELDAATAARIDHLIAVSPTVGGVAGVATQDGRLLYVKPFGYRDVERHLAVDTQTRFEIGSVTKQFTAAAILQLKERGKLTLDEPLATVLPGFPHAKQVTLRQLLHQQSGYPDYVDMPDFREAMERGDYSVARLAQYAAGPLDFKPGTRFEYSSTNYYLLGRVVELTSGQAYDDYVRVHLFGPAHMTHSGFVREERAMPDVAKPYYDGRPTSPSRESWAGGAGAIVSTLGDLIAWNAALARGEIVTTADYRLMISPAHLVDGSLTDYGMGISIDKRDGHLRLWHNGATNGFVAIDSVFPKDRIDIVILENSAGGNDPGIIERALVDGIFPDALAVARQPVKGEVPAMRARIVGVINEILAGTLRRDEATPAFWTFWSARRSKIVAYFGKFGPPQQEIFKGSHDDGDATAYLYRVEFPRDVRDCLVQLDDKTQLVSSIGIQPPG